jgi:hypothetical protein
MEDLCRQRMERVEGDKERLMNSSTERKRSYSNCVELSVNDLLTLILLTWRKW